MNRIDRLYAVMEELRAASPRPLSVSRLARRFEVSSRTVERDLLALQSSGAPIYAEAGRRGGYVLDKRHSLPPLNFTPSEAAAIAVALAANPASPFADATRGALRKVMSAMPPNQAERTREVVERVHVMPEQEPTVPRAIQDAIVAGHALRLNYVDKNGTASVRVVEPAAFVHSQDNWYLAAWCRLRDAGRAFRLDRILDVEDTGEPAPHRPFDEVAAGIPETRTPSLETPT